MVDREETLGWLSSRGRADVKGQQDERHPCADIVGNRNLKGEKEGEELIAGEEFMCGKETSKYE